MIESIISYLDNLWFAYSFLLVYFGVVIWMFARVKPEIKPDDEDYYARRLNIGEATDW